MKEKEHKKTHFGFKTPKMCTSVATASAPSKLMQSRKILNRPAPPPAEIAPAGPVLCTKSLQYQLQNIVLLSILLSTSLSILRCLL